MPVSKVGVKSEYMRISPKLAAVGLAWMLAAVPAVASHDKSDVVSTDDGGTYVGEIKSVQYATLSLKTNPAGTLSIELRYVTGLISKFEYRIELNGGKRHFGTLGPPTKPGHLSIVGSEGALEVELSEIVEIVPIEHGFWKRVDGSANLGFSYTQSNKAVQYNTSGDASYRSRKNYGSLSGQSIFSTQEGGTSTNQHQLQMILAQVGKGRWGLFEVGQLQSNPAQGYDLRTLVGGGATRFVIENSRKLMSLNLGMVYNRENVTDGSEVDQSAEVLVAVGFRRYKRGSHSPGVQVALATFTNVTETPRFRASLNFNVSWKIVGDFKFNFQIIDNYDSAPPGVDSQSNDMSIVTSVGYTF